MDESVNLLVFDPGNCQMGQFVRPNCDDRKLLKMLCCAPLAIVKQQYQIVAVQDGFMDGQEYQVSTVCS